MTGVFKPRMNILLPAQQRLWPELRPAAELGFALYGGTAIALRLGHRASVDFDFFSEKSLDRDALHAAFPFIKLSLVLQDQPNTSTINVPYGDSEREHVKVSFFGTIGFGRVGEPEVTKDGVLQVASLDDLMATKVKVILQRADSVLEALDAKTSCSAQRPRITGTLPPCWALGSTWQQGCLLPVPSMESTFNPVRA